MFNVKWKLYVKKQNHSRVPVSGKACTELWRKRVVPQNTADSIYLPQTRRGTLRWGSISVEAASRSMVILLSLNIISSSDTHKKSNEAFAISHELLLCVGFQLFKLALGLYFLWPGDFNSFHFSRVQTYHLSLRDILCACVFVCMCSVCPFCFENYHQWALSPQVLWDLRYDGESSLTAPPWP